MGLVVTRPSVRWASIAALGVVLVICGLLSGQDKATASDKKVSDAYWPQWQGPAKDAKSTDTGLMKKWPQAGPKMLWSVDRIGAGFSSVTIADGVIYISGAVKKQGFITAIKTDGSVKWRKGYGREWTKTFPGARASVTISNGRLFVFSGAGVVACLDARSGEKKWSVDVVSKFKGRHIWWGYGESLLVVDDKVICTAGGVKGSIIALGVDDGAMVWKTGKLSEKASYSSPIVIKRGGKKLIIQLLTHCLVVVDASNGRVMCKYYLNGYRRKHEDFDYAEITNTPLYDGGFVYVTSGYDAGGAKLKLSEDGRKLTKVWENHDLDVHHGGFVLVDGHIYGSNWITNSKGRWICVNWKTGKTKYKHDWDGKKGSVGYADGMLYCYQERTGMLALVKPSPDKFEIVSSFRITMGKREHWAHPVICGGVLYVRHGDVLMAYDVKAKPQPPLPGV